MTKSFKVHTNPFIDESIKNVEHFYATFKTEQYLAIHIRLLLYVHLSIGNVHVSLNYTST